MQKKMPARIRDKQRKENIILALILAFLFIFVIYMSGRAYTTPDTTTSYIVKPGDTLWEIAEKYCPNHHTGNTVFKIERLNHIDGYIVPGQVLTVPVEPQIFEATAYIWTGDLTATGTFPSRGTVAVDPEVIPLGTKLYIEGYGEAVAADTGSGIQGDIIDLYMDSEQECWDWGRQKVEVVIVE